MKKILATAVLALFVVFSCAGCFGLDNRTGGSNEDTNKNDTTDGGGNLDDNQGTQGGQGDQGDDGNDEPVVVTNETYGSFWMRCHTYKTMPVGAYNALPPQFGTYTYNYLKSPETYAAYQEAGVNVMMGLYEQIDMDALDLCSEYGLAYLMHLGGADNIGSKSLIESSLVRARYHDAFAGLMQSDEPGYVAFEDIKRSADILDGIMPEETTGALWHVNLFPNYANKSQLYYRTSGKTLPEGVESYTYEQYVADYMRICKPKILSYDFYPCNKTEGSLSDGYFQNMAIIRSAALKANIPFWVYIQTCSYSKGTRIPNQADILWQVNTALTYGAKGIQYFTGVVAADGGNETFNGAMFDRDGNRTDVYNYVKTANKQIGAVDEVLMCSKSKGVVVCGTSPWEDCGIPEEDQLTSYGDLSSAEAGHSLVGCFDYDGKTALYITDNSVTEGDSVTLTFKSSVSGYTVVKGEKQTFTGATLTLTPEAGEGILVVIE